MIFQVSSYQIIKIDHCFVSSFSFWSFYEEQYCSIGSEEEDDEEDEGDDEGGFVQEL